MQNKEDSFEEVGGVAKTRPKHQIERIARAG
jgi:hypothetical protein